MLRLSALVFSLLLCVSTMSARTITGKVLSDSDSTAVVGATCRLMSGNQFVNGMVTDPDGKFEISTDSKSTLTLEISMVGFSTTEIVIAPGKNVNVGNVYLSEGVALEGVEVTARSMVDVKGRTVVFPSASDVKASTTAISLFQKLPLAGLETNPINRTLSVDGGTPVILINGIPSSMNDINTLKPDEIAKIEFSRITPARYADRGNSGLISITLKKRDDGGQVYLWGRSALNAIFVDGNMKASYHQGPSQFTLFYHPQWRDYKDVYDNTVQSYIGNDFRVELEEHDRNPFSYNYHNLGMKYDYSPNVHTVFSATFNATPNFSKGSTDAVTVDSYLGKYHVDKHYKTTDFAPSLDLFFKRDFNERNSLELQLVGTLSSTDYLRSNKYIFNDGSLSDYVMDVDSRRHSLISEISYAHQFSEKTSLSVGYQNTVSRSTNTYLTSDYKPVLTENNNYVYARLGQQVGKVYLSLSTGAKMYWIRNDVNKRHFVRNISTARFSWSISRKWSLSGAFQYSPTIPSLSALTDYPQQQSPYLISNGNPNLKVSQNFFYQLNPSYQYKKFTASLLMGYSRVGDQVVSDLTYLGDRVFLSQSVNAKDSWGLGSRLSLKLSDIHGFGANVSLGLEHYETQGETWSHHLTTFSANFTIWWNKGPFTVSYWRTIPGKYLNGNIVGQQEDGDVLSVEYKPNKHWTVEAGWWYLFDKKGSKYPSWGYNPVNPYYRERYIKNNGNMVVVSVSYSTDFGTIFRTTRRSLNNSDNGSSLLKM